MAGFDPEFSDLDHFIRTITARIWEGGQIHAIGHYYTDDCAVISPQGVSVGAQSVIDSTRATLAEFPDRRLLAEDIIQSGNPRDGFLSSHRIISTMTHRGAGRFGPASGCAIQVRTIADCVCRDNRVAHEWLVRDHGAIALATGQSVQSLAQQWLERRGPEAALLWSAPAPAWWRDPISTEPLAQRYADNLNCLLCGLDADPSLFDEAVCLQGPSRTLAYGRAQVHDFYASVAASFDGPQFRCESLVFMPFSAQTGRPMRLALRWRLKGAASGRGRYSAGAGRPLDVLGIHHAEMVRVNGQWQVHREWVLMDEVAIWMQLLDEIFFRE